MSPMSIFDLDTINDLQQIVEPNTLYIVPTPIGNLNDITARALIVLKQVDIIAAEDTRHTNHLLSHYGIQTRTFALHDHNEQHKAQSVVEQIQNGTSMALVSDAGTPLISDPGYHLVNKCREQGVNVVPLPGPSALITALSASGLPSNRFSFEGFLPPKSKARKDILKKLSADARTLIFYESPHRIMDSLQDILDVLGAEREVALARELTKTYESFYKAPIAELIEILNSDANHRRGEMVVMITPFKAEKQEITPEAIDTLTLLVNELPLKKAAALTAQIHTLKKNALYKWGLENL